MSAPHARWPNWARSAFELRALALAATLVFLALVLIKFTGEVVEGDTSAFDLWVLHHLRDAQLQPLGGPVMVDVVRDITALGGVPVQLIVTLGASACLLASNRLAQAAQVLVAVGGGVMWSLLLKTLVGRSRPDAIYHLMAADGHSYPSGHSMLAAVTYLTLAAMLARATPNRRLKLTVALLAMGVAGLVGLSRVYLGVHWASDVMGGWLAGAVWATAAWLAVELATPGRPALPVDGSADGPH